MKEKPTKAKKKGRTIRAFKRDISLESMKLFL